MWLCLELDGIEFHFRITEYRKSIPEKWDEQWCHIDLTLRGDNWLYYTLSSDILLACEVEEIRNRISDLLEDKIQVEKELEFIEPDLTFILIPRKDLCRDPRSYVACGHEIIDVDADLRVHLWSDGVLTANYLSLCFDRNDLECLMVYLQYITNKISRDDKAIQELIKKDVIRPNYNVGTQ